MGISEIRAVYKNFLTQHEAQQLLFIQRGLAVSGYRPHVRSLTLFDLVLAEPRLLPPLVRVRQLVLDAVEEHFDRPCQVFVEHTSLISWSPGASIGWHFDSNRGYLAQRHFSAVLYLNDQGADFMGGTFCFLSGSGPLRIEPSTGTLLLYTAGELNVHQVESVTAGERATLTMWFSLDQAHQEDAKVLAALSSPAMRGCGLPPTMYQTPDGADIRLAPLQRLGVTLVSQPQLQVPAGPSQEQPQQQQQCALLAAAAGQQGTSRVATFGSIQQAVLVVCMLQWKLCPHKHPPSLPAANGAAEQSSYTIGSYAAESPSNQQQQQHSSQNLARCCGCYTDSKLLSRAEQLLQEYLAAAGEQLEQLVPLWQQLGALVAPAPSEQHHLHELSDCG